MTTKSAYRLKCSWRALCGRLRHGVNELRREPKPQEWLDNHARALIGDLDSMRRRECPEDQVERFAMYRIRLAYNAGVDDGLATSRAIFKESFNA